jgi:hypothetical protein
MMGLYTNELEQGITAIETVEEMLNYLNKVVEHDSSKLKSKINYSLGDASTEKALAIPLVHLNEPGITFMISDAK